MIRGTNEQIPYGDRSKYVTSVRIPHGNRPSPDSFGLTFTWRRRCRTRSG
jgi:hypothetical protein